MSILKSLKEQILEDRIDKKINQKISEVQEENQNLRNEIEELRNCLNKTEEKRITANRQLLILHYLDFLNNIQFPSLEKKYDLFRLVIDKNKPAVKNFFLYREMPNKEEFKKIFNEQDLYFLSDLFKQLGLTNEAKKIDSDIIKLKF